MHGAHVLDPVDGVGIEADVVEEPLGVGDHEVQLAREGGAAVLLHFHWLKVLHQLQRSHCDKRGKKGSN